MDEPATKTVGRCLAARRTQGPAEFLERAWRLQQQVDASNPYPKPRGFVFKARTWADYEAWRRQQKNPRLW